MTRRTFSVAGVAVVCCALLAGCGPSADQIAMAKAMSARVDRSPDYNASARFLRDRYVAKRDKDYVMWSMDYSSLCLLGGNYDAAREELLRCYADITHRQDTDKEKAAAVSNEALKIFKGEPFERAMVCTYLGILHYMKGDYNNARIYCARADMEDATTNKDMAAYQHDFRLAHFWLGKAFLRLGREDNARIAFRNACLRIPRKNEGRERTGIERAHTASRKKRMRLERLAYQKACKGENPVRGVADASASPALGEMPSRFDGAAESPVVLKAETPEAFADCDFQKQVNLTLVIETGIGTVKTLVGENQFMDRIDRANYPERAVTVYLDGAYGGRAFRLLDMFHQADTRGMSEKDRTQIAKGVTQSILRRLPYIGSVAAYWDVSADGRYWHLLPGEVLVYSAKVKPGSYTVCLQCFDANGHHLPRHRSTHYRIPVRAGEENIYFLQTRYDHDNTYTPPMK